MRTAIIPFLILSLLSTCARKEDERLWSLLPMSPPPEDVGGFTVGPEGGGYLAEDGLSILIPAGAMETTETFTITKQALDSISDMAAATAVYEITPSYRFRHEIRISLPLDQSALAKAGVEARFRGLIRSEFPQLEGSLKPHDPERWRMLRSERKGDRLHV